MDNQHSTFDFVITSDDPTKAAASQYTRKLVRQRASQLGARTRRRGRLAPRVNRFQPPPWLELHQAPSQAGANDQSFSKPTEHSGKEIQPPRSSSSPRFDCVDLLAQWIGTARSLSPSLPRSLFALRELLEFSRHGMSQTLLSHSGHSSILSEPLRIQKILSLTRKQFFLSLEEQPETSPCVNDAVDCLWAYIQQFLLSEVSPANRDKHVKSYVRALHSIRKALDEGTALNGNDVWSATLILVLYESLNVSGDAWIMHAKGAIHVLESLGPRHIITENQKNLLAAQSAIMITEAIFKNWLCFLSQPEWQITLQRTITLDPTSYNRSEETMKLVMHAAHIPGVFHDATSLIIHKEKNTVDHKELISRTKAVCEDYQKWYGYWQPHLESAVQEMPTLQISEIKRHQIEVFCCYLEHFCLINRLLLAVNPAAGVGLEETVAETARRLREICEQYVGIGQAKYRIGLSACVAESILKTTDRWKEGLFSSSTAVSIEPVVFLDWCKVLGRKVD